jgi:hypothetical protein
MAVVMQLLSHWENLPKPYILHLDNGGEFVNEIINVIAHLLNITIVNGEAYDPRDQGKVKRYNQTFAKILGNENLGDSVLVATVSPHARYSFQIEPPNNLENWT